MADKNWFTETIISFNSSSELEQVISNLTTKGYSAYYYKTCSRCKDCLGLLGNCGNPADTCAMRGAPIRWDITIGDPHATSSESKIFCDTLNATLGEVSLFIPRNFFKRNSTRCESCTSFQI